MTTLIPHIHVHVHNHIKEHYTPTQYCYTYTNTCTCINETVQNSALFQLAVYMYCMYMYLDVHVSTIVLYINHSPLPKIQILYI